MNDLKSHIDPRTLPRHVAIIMDGNGRWAKQKGSRRIFGHKQALRAVRETIEGGVDIGLQFVTLYTFSTENWNRPKAEVRALMELLVSTIQKEVPSLHEQNVRLRAIGNLADLPPRAQRQLQSAMDETARNTGLTLTLALSYGGRWDLTQAARSLAEDAAQGRIAPADVTEDAIRARLSTHFLPDPELMIRTSGEFRISNFLLWELAYAEIFITPTLWPDFTRQDLYAALIDYQKRERRFGKISEQLKNPV